MPENIITCLENVQHALKRCGLDIRWVKPRNIHLTLRFLGDIPEEMCRPVETAIEAASCDFTPLMLSLKGLGVFPGIKKARVIWAGLSGETEALINFQHTLESQLAQMGIKKEPRSFKAHLTLGRIKRKIDPARLLDAVRTCCDFEPESFRADHIILFKSELKPTGAVYTPLFDRKL